MGVNSFATVGGAFLRAMSAAHTHTFEVSNFHCIGGTFSKRIDSKNLKESHKLPGRACPSGHFSAELTDSILGRQREPETENHDETRQPRCQVGETCLTNRERFSREIFLDQGLGQHSFANLALRALHRSGVPDCSMPCEGSCHVR